MPAGRFRPPQYMVHGSHPGMVVKGNIDIANRPKVYNPDGSFSTVRSFSIGVGNHEVLIPQVVGGKVVPFHKAIAYFKRTGKNLGVFNSIAAANSYAEALHQQQARMYR